MKKRKTVRKESGMNAAKVAPVFPMTFGQIGDVTSFCENAVMLSDVDGEMIEFWGS